ncbi:hypothetical protein [Streptosporangium sp. NPDC002524]|uniref:hypothetical protein n=1 Tax=Streptosporangium sp. NPDC002524 TaxID=3154537 RepID=UPI00331A3DFC
MSRMDVHGTVADGFEWVREEFAPPRSTGAGRVRGDQGDHAPGFRARGLRYAFLGAGASGRDGPAGSGSFAGPRSGVAFGCTRRRSGSGRSCPERDRLAAALHRAATAF